MKQSIELLLSFSSFSIHNSSFSFTSPPGPGDKNWQWISVKVMT
jgi:hypothetical protein